MSLKTRQRWAADVSRVLLSTSTPYSELLIFKGITAIYIILSANGMTTRRVGLDFGSLFVSNVWETISFLGWYEKFNWWKLDFKWYGKIKLSLCRDINEWSIHFSSVLNYVIMVTIVNQIKEEKKKHFETKKQSYRKVNPLLLYRFIISH